MVADANAIKPHGPGKQLATMWPRFLSKSSDFRDDAGAIRFLTDRIKLLRGAGFDQDPIACHAVSCP